MTDTVTLPRAEAQQILEALYDDDDGMKASKILSTLLAQPIIVKAITEVEPNENHDPIAWINWNAATGELSVSFEQESELASQPLYYTPVTGYDLEEMTELKEERERQRDHAVVEIQKLIARNAELESHMQGLSNEINDFQNTIERQKRELDTIAQQASPVCELKVKFVAMPVLSNPYIGPPLEPQVAQQAEQAGCRDIPWSVK